MKLLHAYIILLLIIIGGVTFRVFGINWDGACCMHPDERAIVMAAFPLSFPGSLEEFLNPQSPLNPHFFAYGNFPLYLLKGVSFVTSFFDPTLATFEKLNLVGRGISILADIATLLVLFFIGKKIGSTSTGLFASFFYAIAVLPIQNTHFFTVDLLLTFFITLTLYALILFYYKPTFLKSIVIGIFFGAALATKISALPLIVAISVTLFIDFVLIVIKNPHRTHIWFPHIPHVLKTLFKDGVVIVIVTLFTFSLLQPYAIIDFAEFIKQNKVQAEMTRDAFTFPYTLQYVGIIPYVYQLKNIFFWGLGPLLSVISFIGTLFVIFTIVKKGQKETVASEMILFTFFIIYFGIVGSFAVGWMRYMLPLYPLFCLFGAIFVTSFLYPFLKRLISSVIPSYTTIFINSLLILTIIALLIWPISFLQIYTRPNTRIQASEWINNTVLPNSTLALEHWDDALPLWGRENYQSQVLELYNSDTSSKWLIINEQLLHSDYIIIASNRLYTPLQKLHDCNRFPGRCYPKTSKYYQELFSETRGFKKIVEFYSYPTIPFINRYINDQSADESFTVYDHPKIIIFKKTTNNR